MMHGQDKCNKAGLLFKVKVVSQAANTYGQITTFKPCTSRKALQVFFSRTMSISLQNE